MATSTIAVITTASARIGTGHLRRCLTLIDELRRMGAAVDLWVYAGDPAMAAWIAPHVQSMVIDPALTLEQALAAGCSHDTLIIDSYDIREEHLLPIGRAGCRVLVMDDLADRPLPATWVLNSCVDDAVGYLGLTDATLLLGPAYALLRPQFRELAPRAPAGPVRRVMLSFGGSDVLNLNERAWTWLDAVGSGWDVRVIAGPLTASGGRTSHRHRVEPMRDVVDMAGSMRWADLALTAAGQTTFELAAAGCPALCLQVADNQRFTGELASKRGYAWVADARSTGDASLIDTLARLVGDPARRDAMSLAGMAAVDGLGAVRVAEALLGA
jgi:UDP-2,4-diacetamido-2,4,6-trideoxy-beta-L-altropyranose hydrolase